MSENYYELLARPSSHHQIFCDFLLDATDEAVEQCGENGHTLVVRSEYELDDLEWALHQLAEQLSKALQENVTIATKTECKKNEDWIRNYQESIQPVPVPPFYIRPSWHEAQDNGLIDILIDPSLAFGSGHHQTTSSCLQLISKIDPKGMRVLDVGCGSGILSIAASKLGAQVDICDTDPLALESSQKNFEQNGCAYETSWTGSVQQASDEYDLVIANIVADVLVFLRHDLQAKIKPGGYLLLSGIVSAQKDKLLAKYFHLKMVDSLELEGWHTFLFMN